MLIKFIKGYFNLKSRGINVEDHNIVFLYYPKEEHDWLFKQSLINMITKYNKYLQS